MYCYAKGCRELVTSSGKGKLCYRHYLQAIENTSMKPVYMLGNGYGQSMCFLCDSNVEFRFGLYAVHVDENGQRCDASGHEIAALRDYD